MTGRNSISPARWLARRLAALAALALVFSLAGCGGGGSGGGGPPGSGFTIGGSVSGLAGGRSVTLLNNAGDALTLSSNGAFTFASPVPAGGSYLVTVRSQPAGQVCTVGEGTGSGVNANVINVSVICSSSTYTIGGSVSGLAAGQSLSLLNNGSDSLRVSGNGSFSFPTAVARGASYVVTVGSQPAAQVCTVGNGSGTDVAANVNDVSVSCSTSSYTVGGTVSGLAAGQTLTLLDNGGDALTVSGNGSFSFATPVVQGAAYKVTVGTQPAEQSCVVSNGSGTVAGANVDTVALACRTVYAYAVVPSSVLTDQFRVGSGGALWALSPPSHNQGSAIWGITAHPKAPFAYVSDQTSSLVFVYSIGSDGALNAAGFSAASGSQPTNLLVDPGGHYLYVANQGANSLSQYTLGANGAPTPMSPATVSTGSSPLFLAIDSSGRYLYATNGSSNTVSQYTIGASGALSPMGTPSVATGSLPRGIATHPNAAYAYVANNSSSTVSQYAIGSGGALTPLSPATVGAAGSPSGIAVDPSGRYAYAALTSANAVAQYTIAGNGTLSPMATPTIAAGPNAYEIAVDPSGRYVYVGSTGSGTVYQYSIGAGGQLRAMSPASVATDGGVFGLAVH
ncbi:MAG: beta-propeller fold lactonase family protein [Betaproteobacteria bacterium]|nr:beta-propeller fold lactonase family protein [Betaproteobacteria bacterium]MDE1956530.1 beta-propeller fold lactonase family protein [Betaproteobacteria bacterium]MDE2152729.1 beta-propeller fold lactonase family protein [Betaproteobacteria bacterium]